MVHPLLDIRGLSKSFPGVRALDDLSLRVDAGEVVAVVGQNGSGKSTLVKILAGVYHADPGGEIRRGSAGEEATELHFIHQDLGLIPMLTTIENLDLTKSHGRAAILPARTNAERSRAEELIGQFGGDFDVRVPISTLTPAERTLVAIARALDGWTHDRNVLILDEPTASLHGDEVGKLFAAVRRVAERGTGVIFISHRLDEVVDLADRVIALRDGRMVADARRGEFDHDELARMIAGRDIAAASVRESTGRDDVVLRARGVVGERVADIDLAVRAGEVLGVTGQLGSGREQLAALLFGAVRRTAGVVEVEGQVVPPGRPGKAIARGIGYVPADRRRDGAVMNLSVRENLTLAGLRPLRSRWGGFDRGAERREASRWISTVDLRPALPERTLSLFSGGNQQKVVIAKWLRNQPKVLLLDEPTQGVDVGAKASIYALIGEAAQLGAAVLVSSSDTKELTLLCDRVIVLRDGVVADEIDRTSLTEARLVRACLGLHEESLRPEDELTHG